jgi:hypothetical protein
MTDQAIRGSWDKIAKGGSHVAGVEGQRFADALSGAIGKQVQSIADAHGVDAADLSGQRVR